MNFGIKAELDDSGIGFRNQRRNLKYKKHQTGQSNPEVDSKRKALLAGKRMSKNGKIYFEYRKNRSDLR